ncbi:MAG: aldehyde dehydrogenase family protein, partial [Mycobacteriaceae bacterium]
YLYALFSPEATALDEQEQRFRDSVRDRHTTGESPRRTQDRTGAAPEFGPGFTNTPDTDSALPANRKWAAAAIAAEPPPVSSPEVTEVADVDAIVAAAVAAAPTWAQTHAATRAEALRACANALEAARGELVTVMVHEAGKTVAEADPEISEAIDFARYYAERALELDADPDAVFTPHRVVVVTPPWNFPIAIPMGGVLAALAAGAAAIIKPAPQTRACAEVGIAALQQGLQAVGAPEGVLTLVHTDEADAGRRLITHPDVDAVVLTGASDTAALFRSWRPQLRLLAETSGKNSLIVTPSADPDLAVADVLRSAFGHAGQKCSAASLVICVGSVATDPRFRRQLVDAVRSLQVGYGTDLATTMGPVQEQPQGKLLRALTTLEPGERWLVEPRRLDDTGRLWSPGLREGVAPGSFFHLTECFGPVLGIMTADTLDEAIDLQNATDYGLTGGIHSLDQAEVTHWLQRVQVGNAYINRHITGAVVQRQSFGGWKGSVIGPGAKAGGPGYVAQLGTWADRSSDLDDEKWLAAGRESDRAARATTFAVEHDNTGLAAEANVLRYLPLPELAVWSATDAPERELARVRGAAAIAGVPVRVLAGSDESVAEQVGRFSPGTRLRVLGELPEVIAKAAAEAGVSLLDATPVVSGARELSTVYREQAISRTLHRFGHLSPARSSTGK